MPKRRLRQKQPKSHRLRLLPLSVVKRLPLPPPKTKAQRLVRLEQMGQLLVGSCPSFELRHVFACSKCAAAAYARSEDARLREQVRLERRREEIRREHGSAASDPRRRREKFPPEAESEHLSHHPIGKRNADGSLFSGRQRVEAIKREQGITIDRTTLAHRLSEKRRQTTTST